MEPDPTHESSVIEVERLREKYRIERDRRLRPDAEAQYVDPTGALARYFVEDPHAGAAPDREPIVGESQVVVIGGGFSGMLASVRLQQNGVHDVRIIEAGADFGGTWYWNRYPGVQCDIDSYCYLPLLEETGYVPKEKYSYGTEIFEHTQRIGKHFELYEKALFQTRVTELSWDDAARQWRIDTNRGDRLTARYVVMAVGIANRVKLPGVPGLEDFEGRSFHTSRWDYEFTGGDSAGGMHKLANKRVAVIGTGATGIQCVPYLARDAQHLFVFQRTPSSVDLRGNKPTDPEWATSLEPGWQRVRRENFADVVDGKPFEVDLVADAWTDVFRNLMSMPNLEGMSPDEMARQVELADLTKMNWLRSRVDALVHDQADADALKPWYSLFCKRPTFNDEYLPAFNQPNVSLVDTSPSKGVERITSSGVVANGIEYPVDLIVFATGFQITVSDFRKGIGFDVRGRNGKSLYDHWSGGLSTFHGHSTHEFPNWFYIGLSQNALAPNQTHMYDEQATHVAYIIGEAIARGAQTVEADPRAEARWVATIRELAVDRQAFLESCTPGYFNNEGDVRGGIFAETYGPGINAFNRLLKQWREKGTLEGLMVDA